MPKIRVTIQRGDFPSSRDHDFCMNLDPIDYMDALTPLDLPSNSPGWFGTRASTVEIVRRERVVKANEIAKAIWATMNQKDVYDGHTPIDPLHGYGRAGADGEQS